MGIAISPVDFDLNGHLQLEPLVGSDYGQLKRRANRVRTLDGGVTVNDGGFSQGDRTYTLHLRLSQQEAAELAYLIEYHPQVQVGAPDGLFTAIATLRDASDYQILSLDLLEKISEG